MSDLDLAAITAERDRLRSRHLRNDRPASSARGVHHVALLSSDVDQTIRFYQDLLEFPLTEIFENRDYAGSNHGPYEEVLGGLHHIAISVEPQQWQRLRDKLYAAGVGYQEESGSSLYFNDPDGARIELIADDLGSMYGHEVI
jgi:catechol 2,3-dioxygenase-like lactoylglutathione lyase family enzyme